MTPDHIFWLCLAGIAAVTIIMVCIISACARCNPNYKADPIWREDAP